MISKPEIARLHGRETYWGHHCQWDGTYERYTATSECVSCVKHREGVRSGRIEHAIDGRQEKAAAKAKEKTMRFEDI